MAVATPPRRKYTLTKLAPGDYLLPSNDGKAIWRIHRYVEGPSRMAVGWPKDRQVWGYWRWESPVDVGSAVDTGDWSRWEFWDGLYETRGEAIDAALKET